MPGADLSDVATLHLKPSSDTRQAAELQSLITVELKSRGYDVVPEQPDTIFGEGDYIFSYAPDWHWDLDWYLLELRVAIYEPHAETLVAQSQAHFSSMVRKPPEEVVQTALARLFDDEDADTD